MFGIRFLLENRKKRVFEGECLTNKKKNVHLKIETFNKIKNISAIKRQILFFGRKFLFKNTKYFYISLLSKIQKGTLRYKFPPRIYIKIFLKSKKKYPIQMTKASYFGKKFLFRNEKKFLFHLKEKELF